MARLHVLKENFIVIYIDMEQEQQNKDTQQQLWCLEHPIQFDMQKLSP